MPFATSRTHNRIRWIIYGPIAKGQIPAWLVAGALVWLIWFLPDVSEAARPLHYAAYHAEVRQDSGRITTDGLPRQLQAKQSVLWQQAELGQIFASNPWPNIPLWRDRRVDISQSVDFEAEGQAIQVVLDRLAQKTKAQVIVYDEMVAFLPREHAKLLPVFLADARRQATDLPAEIKSKLLRRQSRAWPRLTQPGHLSQQWLQELDKPAEFAQLPYDLWDAGQMPPLPLVEQLALLAFGFEQRIVLRLQDAVLAIDLEPIDSNMACELVLEDSFYRSEIKKLGAQLADRYPAVQLLDDPGSTPRVSGPAAELASLLDRLELQRPVPGTNALAINRYTLKLEGQTLESVVQFIAKQTERSVEIEGSIDERWEKPIFLDAKDMLLDELFETIGKQAGLEIQLGRTQVTVGFPEP